MAVIGGGAGRLHRLLLGAELGLQRRPATATRASAGEAGRECRVGSYRENTAAQRGTKSVSGVSRRANAASSRAVRSRSSSATISLGLCM